MIHGVLLDLRTAFRSLRHARTFPATVIACLALGVGANTAVFSVVRSVLLQPLPFPEPDRLVSLWVGYQGPGSSIRYFVSPQQFTEIRERNTVLAEMAATRVQQVSLDQDGVPVEVTAASVTGSLFPMIGAASILGRTFTVDEDREGAPVALTDNRSSRLSACSPTRRACPPTSRRGFP